MAGGSRQRAGWNGRKSVKAHGALPTIMNDNSIELPLLSIGHATVTLLAVCMPCLI